MKAKKSFPYALTLLIVGAFFIHSAKADSTASKSSTSVGPKVEFQGSKKSFLGIGMGQTFLMGDYGDSGDDSITMDIFYSYNASRTFDLLLAGHYTSHELRGQKTKLFGLTTSIKSRVFNFDSFSPYVLGGLGFYRPKVRRKVGTTFQDSEAKYVFGFNIGAGADLELNQSYTMGLMAAYHNPFKLKQDNQASVDGSYFKLLITLMRAF